MCSRMLQGCQTWAYNWPWRKGCGEKYVALAHANMGSAAYFKGDMAASANAYALALKVNTPRWRGVRRA
ncbi:MAG: hypothetical protein IPG69_06985 [Flavobacteriales bacterium]|nr:hypothetical protein [Flavobacteriales bacterium]